MSLGVGLMSGTSIDGIDAAVVRFSSKADQKPLHLVAFETYRFPQKIRKRVLACSDGKFSDKEELCRLHFELGELFAGAVKKICHKAKIPIGRIDFIGSHGQTVCHLGQEGSVQLGEPSIIAERTGITTVADFRSRDIAAGGTGAPLAPYLHYHLFHSSRLSRAVHNLGGISNLTFLPKNASLKEVTGFDTGPGNMVIDGLMREKSGGRHHFDEDGRVALRGRISLSLLKELLRGPFIGKRPPKTCGREEFGRDFVMTFLSRGERLKLRFEDIVSTATAFTAVSIAENYRRFIFSKGRLDEIIFMGGGVHNETLMTMIRAELVGTKISTLDEYPFGIPSDAAEAVLFALLAHETLQGRPTNLPRVTGARKSVVLGTITPGN
ncbi:MAG: anhydro-N-acetylmuramic acid kinase [Deltaproteobacteria bacterium]|nr:anhydro-N-acetylmuramic acid kinase [Deltaproteobacteria bacterium]MBI2500263.1 anhydro-N-acetylmuramic acid kinase [Deltaproteobacteria bacterium]